MNTNAGTARASRPDHRFHIYGAVVAFAVIFAGFARTYYLKFLFGTPALPWLLYLHGALMTSWFALFFVQTCLIATRRVAWHRRLGVIGAVLAASIVMVAVTVLVHALVRDLHDPVGGPRAIVFLGAGLMNIAVFAALVSVAVALRRRGDYHKRLMLLAMLSLLVAAIARIPLGFIEHGGLSTAILLTDLCIVAALTIDTFLHHRLHPAFAWGAALFIVSMHVANIGARTQAWVRFATWLVT